MMWLGVLPDGSAWEADEFVGLPVTVAGRSVGRVSAAQQTPDGIVVDMVLDDDPRFRGPGVADGLSVGR